MSLTVAGCEHVSECKSESECVLKVFESVTLGVSKCECGVRVRRCLNTSASVSLSILSVNMCEGADTPWFPSVSVGLGADKCLDVSTSVSLRMLGYEWSLRVRKFLQVSECESQGTGV